MGVEVEGENFLAHIMGGDGKRRGNGGFARSAFLGDKGNDSHGGIITSRRLSATVLLRYCIMMLERCGAFTP